MYLYFTLILTSSQQQRRSTGNEAGREYTWPRKGCEDRMRKPAGMTRGILSVLPSGTVSPYASASRASASSLCFCRLPFSALSARRTGGWVRCSTENKPSFWIPREKIWLGRGGVDDPRKISEKENCELVSHFKGVCVIGSALYSSQSVFSKH